MLMESFRSVFEAHIVPSGFSRLTPFLVLGRVSSGQVALANYIPPILELHGGKLSILDGIHRDFIAKNAGSTIQAVQIEHVGVELPFHGQPWDQIRVTDEKPPDIRDRYFDLKPALFRDLKALGIDG